MCHVAKPVKKKGRQNDNIIALVGIAPEDLGHSVLPHTVGTNGVMVVYKRQSPSLGVLISTPELSCYQSIMAR